MIQTPTSENMPQVAATIDLDAIAHNVGILADRAGDAGIMAVIKADGYGHGAVPIARTVLRAGVPELGVATIEEACELRNAGIASPITAWLYSPGAPLSTALEADVGVAIAAPWQVEALLEAVAQSGKTAEVTPKLDTGLGRSGITHAQWPAVLVQLAHAEAEGKIHVRGLMGHFAHADDPGNPIIAQQIENLQIAIIQARQAGLHPDVNHHANSAGLLTRGGMGFELARPGIALYGLNPLPTSQEFGLRPAMTWSAVVSLVKAIPQGTGVSYGHQWIAPRDTVIAVVPVGYADGVVRRLSGKFDLMIGGRRFPQVGRVCMDQIVVDLGPDGGGITEGDVAVIFGNGGRGEPSAQEWADKLETIHYEVITMPRGRTVRRYIGSHAATDAQNY